MRKYVVEWTLPYQLDNERCFSSSDYDKMEDAWRKANEVSAELPLQRVSVFRNNIRIKRNGAKYYL